MTEHSPPKDDLDVVEVYFKRMDDLILQARRTPSPDLIHCDSLLDILLEKVFNKVEYIMYVQHRYLNLGNQCHSPSECCTGGWNRPLCWVALLLLRLLQLPD